MKSRTILDAYLCVLSDRRDGRRCPRYNAVRAPVDWYRHPCRHFVSMEDVGDMCLRAYERVDTFRRDYLLPDPVHSYRHKFLGR